MRLRRLRRGAGKDDAALLRVACAVGLVAQVGDGGERGEERIELVGAKQGGVVGVGWGGGERGKGGDEGAQGGLERPTRRDAGFGRAAGAGGYGWLRWRGRWEKGRRGRTQAEAGGGSTGERFDDGGVGQERAETREQRDGAEGEAAKEGDGEGAHAER